MAKQTVNIGVTANDNTGDPLRTAFDKLNDNFDEVYAAGPVGTNLQISDNTIASTNTNGNIDLNPAGTGTIILNGPTQANGVVSLNSTVTGNIIPTSANTYNLGSSAVPFKEAFISGGSLHIGNLVLKEVDTMLEIYQADGVTNAILSGNSTTSGTVLNNGNSVVSLTQNGPITFFANNYQDPSPTTTVINTSNITTPNVVTSGDVTATGNISGDYILGTTAVISTATVQGATVVATGNVTGGNLTTAGDVTTATVTASGNVNVTGDVLATNVWGTLKTADQPNVTGVGTLTDLQVDGDLSIANASAVIDCYNVTANGTVTATTFQSTTGNTSVSDSGITLNDGSTQTTAFVPHVIWQTADGNVIQSTPTSAFGQSIALKAGKHYEFMGHLILDNQSTGNIEVGYTESAGDMSEFFSAITSGQQGAGVSYTLFYSGVSSATTIFDQVGSYHIQFVGTCTPTSDTNLTINVSNTTGNVVVKTGSSWRAFEYNADTIGNIV